MRLGRKTRRFNGLPDLYIFKCQKCDMSHTEKAPRQAKPSPRSKLALGISTSSATQHAKSKDAISYRGRHDDERNAETMCVQSDELHTKSVLIVEDDKRLMHCLTLAMEARGFEVMNAESVFNAIVQIKLRAPEYAVVDLRLGDGCGLDVISALKERRPDARAIILTGYGNIATAVRAVKLGAVDYLTKPADVDDVVSTLLASNGGKAEPPSHPMSAARVRWEHIQHVHEACGHNVSETSRRLNMHRRTLQRILTRHPTSEFLVREPE